MNDFIPVQYLGNEKEISEIVKRTIDMLETQYKIKISHEQLIPAFVDCFLNASFYKSTEFIKTRNKQTIELNLFDLIRVIHEINDDLELVTVISLGRKGIGKLDLEFEDLDIEEANIATLDIKTLEDICITATDYLENNHAYKFKNYQIIFKVCEVFFNEVLDFIKEKKVEGDTLTILDQFTIMLDDEGLFESIELTPAQQEIIDTMFNERMNKLEELEQEDSQEEEK